MRTPLLYISIAVILQAHTTRSIKCITSDDGSKENEVVKECSPNNNACGVLWTGPTAGKAVVTQKSCWIDNGFTKTVCNVGPCIPQRIEKVKNEAAYFCCCKGDLCNKFPESITIVSTDPPILNSLNAADSRVGAAPAPQAWWYTPGIVLLSSCIVLAALLLSAVLVLKWRKRNTFSYRDLEAARENAPKIDLDKQLCDSSDSFPHQIWLGSFRPRHSHRHPRHSNSYHSVSLLGGERVTVRVSDQASAVRWESETHLLASITLSHAHVVSVLWWGKKHRKSWLVYRDVYLGSLTHVLQHCSLSIEQVKRLCEGLFSGLAHLHCTVHAGSRSKVALAHGDIRTDNILLKHNFIPVLGNFHNAIKLQYSNFDKLSASVETISKLMSSNHYLAPELFLARGCFLFDNSFRQMDVYSASLVIWQIISRCIDAGSLPYSLPYEQDVGLSPSLGEMAAAVKETRPTLHSYWLRQPELRRLCWLVQMGWKAAPAQRLTAHCIHRLLRDSAALDALCGGSVRATSLC